MRRRGRAILSFLALLACATFARGGEWTGVAFEQASPPAMRCWFVLPTRLVPDDADLPFSGKPAPFTLRAGRNETECVQLVVLQTRKVEGVSVQFGEFAAGDGAARLDGARNFRANKLAQVSGSLATRAARPLATWDMVSPDASAATITPAMYSPSAARVIPDPLMLDESFDLEIGLSRIWLTVRVPADAKPGEYRGAVRLLKGGELLHEIPLTLRVLNYRLPEISSLLILADVQPPSPRPAWKDLQPFYDDLKAHRINATGEILPLPMWRRDHPPPDTAEYEAALKHVLDELKFARFRFPAGNEMHAAAEFEPAPAVASAASDGIWIVEPTPRFTPASNPSEARLAKFDDKSVDRNAHAFENPFADPVYIWLQVDPLAPAGEKKLAIDGNVIGAIAQDSAAAAAMGWASLPNPVTLSPGRHVLTAESAGAIFLTPEPQPNFEKLMCERARLSAESRDKLGYHAHQMSDWLRARGWLKKSQLKLEEDASPADFGQVALLHDYVSEILPMVRRESAQPPSPALRKLVEVWTPDLSAARFDPEEWTRALLPGQELWASHESVRKLGYPPIAMRLLPWTLARHQFAGLSLGIVNSETDPLIYPDPKTGRPVDSLRFELLREGLEDVEMLQLLRQAMDDCVGRNVSDKPTLAAIDRGQKLFEQTIPALVRSGQDFTWDPAALQAARDEAAELLSLFSTSQ